MSRLYARALIVLGVLGACGATGKLALVSLSHGAPSPAVIYACPEGGPAHRPGCPWVDWTRKDLERLPGMKAAEHRGLCEACFTGELPTRTASTRSPLPVPTGTESPR